MVRGAGGGVLRDICFTRPVFGGRGGVEGLPRFLGTQKEFHQFKYQRYMKRYLATIASIDESVGQLLDYLDENHLTENTKSYQLIKSVLDDSSKAVYQGKIFVNSEAQKTDGYQLSKAILLNEASEFNAKPELEIYADDVKCSHGSASGSLDEDSIFYLMSRGLNYQQSRELLINGFLLDVIEKITDSEIKNLIKNTIGLKE